MVERLDRREVVVATVELVLYAPLAWVAIMSDWAYGTRWVALVAAFAVPRVVGRLLRIRLGMAPSLAVQLRDAFRRFRGTRLSGGPPE
jgi:hypothetical protein